MEQRNGGTGYSATVGSATGNRHNEPSGFPIEELQLDLGTMRMIVEALNDPSPNSSIVINGNEFGSQKLLASNGCRCKEIEVGFVCKKCHLAFRTEQSILRHQQNQNQNGCCGNGGLLRVKRYLYACKRCDENCTFNAAVELQRHLDSNHPPRSDAASPLSGEMEDVVNQITALAAAKRTTSPPDNNNGGGDTNANLFCQSQIDLAARKSKLFVMPNSVAASANSQ